MRMVEDSDDSSDHLFAYPLESNFSGARYPLDLTTTVQTGASPCTRESQAGTGPCKDRGPGQRWWVLLDAAKACSTLPPDLSVHKPDFVVSDLDQNSTTPSNGRIQ
jgi:molybdenum cofactor sulfurtransferase